MPRQSATTRAPARRGAVARAQSSRRVRRGLVLAWSVSREAAAILGITADGGGGAGMARLELRVPWPDLVRPADIHAAFVDGPVRRDIPIEGRAAATWQRQADLWHLDLRGLLCVTLRQTPGEGAGAVALYARTDLISRLGLPGGRYEFEGAAAAEL